MRDPIIAEVRRIRAKIARKRARNPNYDAELHERMLKVCDVVIDAEGKPHYITNKQKMYDVLIAPRIAKEAARAKCRARRRASSGRNSQSKNG